MSHPPPHSSAFLLPVAFIAFRPWSDFPRIRSAHRPQPPCPSRSSMSLSLHSLESLPHVRPEYLPEKLVVHPSIRNPEREITPAEEICRYIALDDLFAVEGDGRLGTLWDTNAEFRDRIRTAARQDFVTNLQHDVHGFQVKSEKYRNAIREIANDKKSSLMSYWTYEEDVEKRLRLPVPTTPTPDVDDDENDSPRPHHSRPRRLLLLYPALTAVLADPTYRLPAGLTGGLFISRLAALTRAFRPDHVAGSWMDIVGRPRGSNHAWHQDSAGYRGDTVMLGFPAENEYEGNGVFSHVIRLSHEIRSTDGEDPRNPRTFDDAFPEKLVWRPVYKKGCEILVYRDSQILHSAPDVIHRASIWRFM